MFCKATRTSNGTARRPYAKGVIVKSTRGGGVSETMGCPIPETNITQTVELFQRTLDQEKQSDLRLKFETVLRHGNEIW